MHLETFSEDFPTWNVSDSWKNSKVPSHLSLREIPFLFVCFLCLGLAFLLLFCFLGYIFLMGFLFRGSKSRNFGFSTDRHSIRFDVSRQMRFGVFRGEIFFQNLQNQDMTTTEGFASVRESVTSRDAEVTAQRLDFQYVSLFSFFFMIED